MSVTEAIFGVREFIPAFFAFVASFVGLVAGEEGGRRKKKEDRESGDESPHSKVDVCWQGETTGGLTAPRLPGLFD